MGSCRGKRGKLHSASNIQLSRVFKDKRNFPDKEELFQLQGGGRCIGCEREQLGTVSPGQPDLKNGSRVTCRRMDVSLLSRDNLKGVCMGLSFGGFVGSLVAEVLCGHVSSLGGDILLNKADGPCHLRAFRLVQGGRQYTDF